MNIYKNLKFILVLSVLVFLVMGFVSAIDDTSNETILISNSDVDEVSSSEYSLDEKVLVADDTFIDGNSTKNHDILTASEDIGSLDDLKNELNSTNSEITLTHKYYTGNYQVISIANNNTIINGNGATIYGVHLPDTFINVYGNNITFKNLKFENITAGSARVIHTFYSHGFNTTLYNCSFQNIQSAFGAIQLDGNCSTIKSCNFDHITSLRNHASVLTIYGYYFKLIDSNFTYNRANQYESTINLYSPSYLISGCIFKHNYGDRYNSVLRITASGEVENCIFINNTNRLTDSGRGGCIGMYSLIFLNITGCTFINNTSPSNGAGVNVQQYSACNIKECYFEGNNANGNGGAVFFNADNSVIDNCTFVNNHAIQGGAVHFNGRNCNITNCNLINNTATEGGAIKFNAVNGYMGFCNYTNNSATIDGGALCSAATGSTVESCTFTNNTAPVGKDFYAHDGKTITFIGLKFPTLWLTNNNAQYSVTDGYGTWYDRPAAWRDDYDFLKSFLDTSQGKATIYLVGDITSLSEKILNIPNIEIIGYDPIMNPTGATIDMAGWDHRAFTVQADNVQFSNLLFEKADIESSIDGGAIKIDGDSCIIDNCTFNNININGSGGAIYVSGDACEISDSKFTYVTANNGNGGAVYLKNTGKEINAFVISGSTFQHNSACNGSAIYISNCTNNSMILSSKISYNTATGSKVYINNTSNFISPGAIYIQGSIYYYVDDVTKELFEHNISPNVGLSVDNISAVYARTLLDVVYAKLGATGEGNNRTNPIDLRLSFSAVAPNGKIIVIDSDEIYNFNGNIIIFGKNNVTIIGNNTNIQHAGLTFNKYARDVKMSNFTFFNNTGNEFFSIASNNIKLVNCNFRDSNVTYEGYYLTISGDNVELSGCVFDNITVNGRYGVLSVLGNNTVLDDCDFINNSCVNVTFISNDVVLNNCNFTGNNLINGSCVAVVDGSVNINNTVFVDNVALNNNGTAICNVGTDSMFIVNCLFLGNVACENGGAIYSVNPIIIVNGTFMNNSAVNGSAIYMLGSVLNITDSIFACPKFDENNNKLIGYIYTNQNINLNNLTLSFTDLNKVVSDANSNLSLEFNYKYFEDYDSAFVGGVSVSNALTVNGNNHILDGSGLARILSVNNCVLNDIVFVNGSAQDGGAIQGSNAHVNNCTFMNNTGTHYGSTIMCNSFNITNCVFKDNPGANSNINFNTSTNNCYNNTFYDSGKVTNSGNDCVVVIQYNSFLNGGYPDVRSHTDASYNWFGYNRLSFNDYPCLNATLNFVSVKKENDKYVYVFNVTFVKSDTGDVVCVNWTRPVNYTITNNNNVSENITGLNTNAVWSSSNVLSNLSATVDSQNLEPELYPYMVLQYLIESSLTGSVLVLYHDYTYSTVVDAGNLPNGMVINKKLSIEGNGHVINGLSNGTCRAFYITGNNVLINNITIKNSKRLGSDGGAIYWSGNYGSISNSTFINNGDSSWGYCKGGAIYWSGSYANIDNCNFTGNSVGLGGSAVWLQGNYADISFSNFTGGSSNGWGGTLVLNSAKYCTVSDCIFQSTNSAASGGAIHQYNVYCDNLTVLNTRFIDCYARDSAGALTVSSPNAYVFNSTFENCNHNNYVGVNITGGAVSWSGANGQLLNSTFVGNYIHYQFSNRGINGFGGAVSWTGSNGVLGYCNFTSNYIENRYAERNGGAVYWSGSEGNIIYCNFQNHNALNGGAVYIVGSSCNVNNSVFEDNHAVNSGGAIYSIGIALINSSVFKDNSASDGGAIYSSDSLSIVFCEFVNNSADYGGAIYLLDDDSTILNSVFSENHAINGSAIYVVTSVNHWYDLNFNANVASNNATVYFNGDSTVYSNNLSFTGNVIPNALHIVGTDHIYSPLLYVNSSHPGFGIIAIEPISLEKALDNILPDGKIIMMSDYTLDEILKFINLNNITVVGNKTKLKDKYLFILPIIQKYIKKKQIVF